MRNRRVLSLSIMAFLCCIVGIMHVGALPPDLLQLVDQYENNTHQIADLNQNRTSLERNTSDLNASLTALQEQIQQSENTTKEFRSGIDALEMTIQEDNNKKNITEHNLYRLTVLNKKEPIIFLGTVTGMIAGVWIVSLFLVILWRK
jgi:septal ring factor EnvC (AmiA/AmiB activator)